MEMIQRSCPVCGSTDTGRIFAEADYDLDRLDGFAFASRKMPEYMHYRLIECPACDLLYANPVPRQEYLAAGYSDAAYDSGTEARYAAATYGNILATFADRLPDRHGALDIGAGDGAFLERLVEQGFDRVAGIEPSRAPVAAARPDIRPLLREDIFRPDDFAADSFSLVTCFQTIEHLHDPLAMAHGIYRLLKPGGIAFFICHNRRALTNRLLGRKSPIFDIEHLQLFSPASTRHLMETAGFARVQVRPVVNRYPLRYWFRLLPFPRDLKNSSIGLLDRLGLGDRSVAIPVGNIAVIGFKPAQPAMSLSSGGDT